MVLGYFYMPNYLAKKVHFDMKGFLIFASASLLLSVALEIMGNTVNMTPVLVIFLSGFMMLYFYYKHARRDDNPLFPLNLFQIRTFRVGIAGNLATRIGISAVPLLIPLLIQIAYGQSAVVSGWIVR